MPFESEAQRKWMYANEPEMAKRWQEHTPKGKKLPEHVESKKESVDQDGLLSLAKRAAGGLPPVTRHIEQPSAGPSGQFSSRPAPAPAVPHVPETRKQLQKVAAPAPMTPRELDGRITGTMLGGVTGYLGGEELGKRLGTGLGTRGARTALRGMGEAARASELSQLKHPLGRFNGGPFSAADLIEAARPSQLGRRGHGPDIAALLQGTRRTVTGGLKQTLRALIQRWGRAGGMIGGGLGILGGGLLGGTAAGNFGKYLDNKQAGFMQDIGGKSLLEHGKSLMSSMGGIKQQAGRTGAGLMGNLGAMPMWAKVMMAGSPLAAYGLYDFFNKRKPEANEKLGSANLKRLTMLKQASATKICVDYLGYMADQLPLRKQAGVRSVQTMLACGAPLNKAVGLSYPEKNAADCTKLVKQIAAASHKYAAARWKHIKAARQEKKAFGLGLGAVGGGALGGMQAPAGKGLEGVGRGILTGGATGLGADIGGGLGAAAGLGAARHMKNPAIMALLTALLGGAGGGMLGNRLGHSLAGKPSWQQKKSIAPMGPTEITEKAAFGALLRSAGRGLMGMGRSMGLVGTGRSMGRGLGGAVSKAMPPAPAAKGVPAQMGAGLGNSGSMTIPATQGTGAMRGNLGY